MKRHKSGAQKRKEAAAAQESVKKLTKVTQFFSVSRAETETDSATLPAVPISDTLSLVSAAAASTTESENVLCESVELNLPSEPCRLRLWGQKMRPSILHRHFRTVRLTLGTQRSGLTSYQIRNGLTSSEEDLGKL